MALCAIDYYGAFIADRYINKHVTKLLNDMIAEEATRSRIPVLDKIYADMSMAETPQHVNGISTLGMVGQFAVWPGTNENEKELDDQLTPAEFLDNFELVLQLKESVINSALAKLHETE